MNRLIGLCVSCPNASDSNNKCCTESVIPVLALSYYDAVIESQKVVFDLKFWNYERFEEEQRIERY